nr:MAG TPA: hypothetical protein [Bacteriophage sp.]
MICRIELQYVPLCLQLMETGEDSRCKEVMTSQLSE